MSLKCYYHPERESITKCETCGRLICVACKTVVHRTHGTNEDRYSTRHEVCVPCKLDEELQKFSMTRIIATFSIFFIFIIIFISITTVTNTQMRDPILRFLPIIGIVALIIITIGYLIWMIFKRPKEIAKIKIQKEEFLKSIKVPTSIKEEEIITKFCPECGTRVEPDTSVCSYCGFIIKE